MVRHRLPPLRLLTTFEAVLRTGGVQNAAAELNVTQPAVSQALRTLEEHIGAKLLDRRKRPAALTEAGRILFRAVSSGIEQIAAAIAQIEAMESTERNVVTIACSICTGTYWLMPRLAAFYGQHPDVTVRIVTAPARPRSTPDTDLAIRYGSGDWPDGRSELLFRERMMPVCSPEAVARFGAGDLERATLLHVETEEDYWPGWDEYFAMTGLPGGRKADHAFGNYVQATQAAIAGMGVMLGWVSNSDDLVRQGQLAVFRDEPVPASGAYYLVTPARGPSKAASTLLASHLRACSAGA